MQSLLLYFGRKKMNEIWITITRVWGHDHPPVKHTPEFSHVRAFVHTVSSTCQYPILPHILGAIFNAMSSMEILRCTQWRITLLTWPSMRYVCLSMSLIIFYLAYCQFFCCNLSEEKVSNLNYLYFPIYPFKWQQALNKNCEIVCFPIETLELKLDLDLSFSFVQVSPFILIHPFWTGSPYFKHCQSFDWN